jgi:sugar lactone lactonase YvrE/pimeloyl-ACP methyl ester carboxylesterase
VTHERNDLSPGGSELWFDPRRGSDKAFRKALKDLADKSGHAELTRVPWCLWGHSGGGIWSDIMATLHPKRVVAIWMRSGAAIMFLTHPEFTRPTVPEAMYAIPMMCNTGVKEKPPWMNTPGAVEKMTPEARLKGPWPGTLQTFKDYRARGTPIGFAPDPRTDHECGDSRYLAIPFLDACLAMRLPDRESTDQTLKPVDMKQAWLAPLLGTEARPASDYQGNPNEAVWLPNEAVAKAWMEYVKTGAVSDSTPPPAPFDVKVWPRGADGDRGAEIVWDAEADFECGIRSFVVLRDGKELARVPQAPVGKFGRPLFQSMTYHDTPSKPLPEMRYLDTTFQDAARHTYQVVTVNSVGLKSEPSVVATAYPRVNLATTFQVDAAWPEKREELRPGAMSGVAVDAADNIWVLARANPPVRVYRPDGTFVRAWGEGLLHTPHQLRIDAAGNVWLVDSGSHVVIQCTPEGKVIRMLGTRAQAGCDDRHFNRPADVAVSPWGDVFVADGYGNARVARFDKDGNFVKAWGKLGTQPGAFSLPHSIALDSKGRVYVADRNNVRIQVFDQDGKFLDQWGNIVTPCSFSMTKDDELWVCGSLPMRWRDGDKVLGYPPDNQLFMKFDSSGKLLQLAAIPKGEDGKEKPGELNWVHGIALDSQANIYAVDIMGQRAQKFVARASVTDRKRQGEKETGKQGARREGGDPARPAFSGEKSTWHDGFVRYDYLMDEETLEITPFKAPEGEKFGVKDPPRGKRRCIVVAPREPAAGNPWSWRGCYWDHQPQGEIELLRRGFHIAYISANAMLRPGKHWDAWYWFLTDKHGLAKKPAFIGMSRGGEFAYTWAVANPDKVACIYADNPGGTPDLLTKIGVLANHDVPLLHVNGSIDPILGRYSTAIEGIYHAMGGRISVMIKDGAGHHPHSLRDPGPIADFIVQSVQPVKNDPPEYLKGRIVRRSFYSTENQYRDFSKEGTHITCRGPAFSECYDRYDFELPGVDGVTTIILPRTPAEGKPWVFRAGFVDWDAAVDLALLAKGFQIVVGPVPYNADGPTLPHWNAVYKHLVAHGFAKKPVMEGAGRAAGEVYGWAIENPDKVSCIYAESPVLRGHISKKPLLDNLEPLAKAGIPLLHVCGKLDPALKDQTQVVEKRYKDLGGQITVILRDGEGHYPLAPRDPQPVVEFVVTKSK